MTDSSPTSSSDQVAYHGIIPPMVTPLKDYDTIDEAGCERLVTHQLEGGVHGLFILGTTGEAPSLSYRLREKFIHQVCKQVNKQIPVLVGITDPAFVETLRLAEMAAEAGADAVVLSMPYYFPAGQTELTQYIERIVPRLPLPVMLYNMPSLTKVWFKIESLKRLVEMPQIVGIKDSGDDIDYFAQLMQFKKTRPDWSILIGPEHLLVESIALGGHGGVNGGANLFPKLFSRAYQAAVDGDAALTNAYQKEIEKLQAIYEIGKYASRRIKALKSGLSLGGICEDGLAEPFNAFHQPEREKVQEVINTLDRKLVL
ncbi:Dihydrodipicolinate synthase DapA [Planctomycetales bacterium 10988]|nr:Dihydrodipicolinate synthase DapA [Planctomycetales bacterium 10988]